MLAMDIIKEAPTASTNGQRKLSAKLAAANLEDLDPLADALYRCLQSKKGSKQHDKLLAFFAVFLDVDATEDQKTRIADRLLLDLVPAGLLAKDRIVRYRVSQIIYQVLNKVEEFSLDDKEFDALISSLCSHSMDKEAAVRSFIVGCLIILQTDQPKVTETLVEMLEFDPSADIRISILLNIEVDDDKSIEKIVQRSRDIDVSVRKAFYVRLALPGLKEALGADKLRAIYSVGLLDRDESVCNACLDGICKKWIETGNTYGLYHELNQANVFDGDAQGMVVLEKVLKYFFEKTPDYSIEYNVEKWLVMDKTHAIVSRCYIEHLHAKNDYANLDQALPPVPAHIAALEKSFENIGAAEVDNEADHETVFTQLMLIALVQDYSDEHGRVLMIEFLKTTLIAMDMQDEIVGLMVQLLCALTLGESDFTMLASEILREIVGSEADEHAALMTSCMKIACHVLQNVDKSCSENPNLGGIYEEFVLPGLENFEGEVEVTGYALKCLGLLCLIDRPIAAKSVEKLLEFSECATRQLEITSLEILFDLVMFYRPSFFPTFPQIFTLFTSTLESTTPSLQRIAVIGTTKLFFSKCLADYTPLTALLSLLFSTGTDAGVTQCLAYFFSVYPYTSVENQRGIMGVAVGFIRTVGANGGWNVAGTSIAARVCEWTDSTRIVGKKTQECVHMSLASQVLETLAADPSDKLMWTVLGGLRFFGSVEGRVLEGLKKGVEGLYAKAPDTKSFTALKKLSGMLETLEAEDESDEEEEELSVVIEEGEKDVSIVVEEDKSVELDAPVAVEESEDEEM